MVHCIGIIAAVAVYSTVYTNSETWYTHNHESDSEKLSLKLLLGNTHHRFSFYIMVAVKLYDVIDILSFACYHCKFSPATYYELKVSESVSTWTAN